MKSFIKVGTKLRFEIKADVEVFDRFWRTWCDVTSVV